jgi:malto-oligosyltrehalose synthase/4-alpha-glucanotransferase
MLNPVSTYRLQFNKDFTLDHFEKIIPYLKKLGVETIYASPIFEATPGSTHGYDGVNPHRINPEIGTEQQLRYICKVLTEHGMKWLQDIVPNHMAYHPNNTWLMDVLEKGRYSPYHSFFDIDWNSNLHQGRVMVPFLGSSLEEVIKNGELSIDYQNGKFVLQYFDFNFPLATSSYVLLLQSADGEQPAELKELSEQILRMETLTKEAFNIRWQQLLKDFSLLMSDKNFFNYIEKSLKNINNDKSLLNTIVDQQVYRLCYWQETDHQINFRRFFTINGLICLNIQEEEVFSHYHQYIHSLLKDGIIQGLRIDHIDGLYDPAAYLITLRKLTGPETYIIVEKILDPNENLPAHWPIQGNTGYDFLALVNNLLTNKKSEHVFTQFYDRLTSNEISVCQQIRNKKAYILCNHMAGELENLTQLYIRSGLREDIKNTDLSYDAIKKAIAEILIECPVYRYYGNKFPLEKEDETAFNEVLSNIRKHKPELISAIGLLENALLLKPKTADVEYNNKAANFYMRLMQFSGPLMAKGVEDTLMYTYNRFIGSNEVGNSPEMFGFPPGDFHETMISRQKKWPLSLNGSATHDTKRGEDVNARLNVITDLPQEWFTAVEAWRKLNKSLKENETPDINDEYFIYQALVGTFPFDSQDEITFSERFCAYLIKAFREAKTHTNWTVPNEMYESAAINFARNLLDKKKPFWKSFEKFLNKIKDFGIINSLSKVLLKFTCPGIPDVYQGCELWDFSMVDPDNRRPVNYQQRLDCLDNLYVHEYKDPVLFMQMLWDTRYNANIKFWLIHTLLNERKNNVDLFKKGAYIPLITEGKYKDHIFAFARKHKQEWYVAAVPLNLAALCREQKKGILQLDWKNTSITLPEEAPERWMHFFSKDEGRQKNGITVKEIFKTIPLALLKLQMPKTDRSAGILMHISSLPSPFGIGDFGSEAINFANFLSRSHQKFWQILPLNVTEEASAHSPYSSISSMAGNTLFISPEILAAQGLLDPNDLLAYHLKPTGTVDFKAASEIKNTLLSKAFGNFEQHSNGAVSYDDLHKFIEQEVAWLDDFALYVIIKRQHGGKPWYEWPDKFKTRDHHTLAAFSQQHKRPLIEIKWQQYIFSLQWKELKDYCNNLNIQFFGDLPFYVSYDSADVWSNPEIFSLDEEGNITGVAGVPPDYFNADGQLWGMPVFKWDVLKQTKYDWWIQRIKKNMELYDVLRLDHFRAFSAYWEVPAKDNTAKNGVWKPGPGKDFFNVMNQTFGKLPFIAEDLGDINEDVHKLRDEFNLPGMKVLQFAFGDDMPGSIYIPHNYNSNYVSYTGTHDNNTSLGWFRQNIGSIERKNIEMYTNVKPHEQNIHLILGKLAYASVAKTVILPIQDVLGLDENARMNTPSSIENNWKWSIKPGQLTRKEEARLRQWVKLYNR